jgi:hypothetical protein
LEFTVFGFVRLLDDFCAGRFRATAVLFHIFYEYCEALRTEAQFGRSFLI